jgi:hypothetical protein
MPGERQVGMANGTAPVSARESGRAGGVGWIAGIVLPATFLCGLNCLKPLVVDDPAYHAYAAHIAHAPLDPYGFIIQWYDHPQPANEVLAPLVIPYWWTLGIRFFGDDPLLAKLWLWPWCLILAISIHALTRRFAANAATPLTWMILLSPAVLVSLNLMLDVPALTLSLASLAVLIGTLERGPTAGAIGSGLLAGLAMQTKYTALIVPVELIAAGVFLRERKGVYRAVIAASVAIGVFVGWEILIAAKYGSSHFLYHVGHDPGGRFRRSDLFWPLFGLLGSTASPLIVLASARRTWLGMTLVCGTVVAGFVLVALIPRPIETTKWTPTAVIFGVLGAGVVASVISAIWRSQSSANRAFLIAWLALELAGYFVLTPWPAVRRVIGLSVVMTMIVGRDLAGSRLWIAAALSIGLGLLLETVDIENGSIERDAVAEIASELSSRHSGGTVWFTGRRGWFYYAERAGWKPIDPGTTHAQADDWLVIPDDSFGGPRIRIPNSAVLLENREFWSRWAIGTIPYFYGTNAAIRKREGPYLTTRIYRLIEPARLVSEIDQP